jgi:prephenate dehydrogenase
MTAADRDGRPPPAPPEPVAILGTGLIGGSVALAARRSGAEVVCWDPDGATREALRQAGLGEARSLDEALSAARLVVVAAPLDELRTVFGEIGCSGAAAGDRLVVTDVASVKGPALSAAGTLVEAGIGFVGGHPLAGKEGSGFSEAEPGLFEGRPWALCLDGARLDDVARVARLVRAVGARALLVEAAEHDAAVALVSGAVHLAAAALALALAGGEGGVLAPLLAARSFREATRVALGPASRTAAMLCGNDAALHRATKALARALAELEGALEKREALEALLERARDTRARLDAADDGEGEEVERLSETDARDRLLAFGRAGRAVHELRVLPDGTVEAVVERAGERSRTSTPEGTGT